MQCNKRRTVHTAARLAVTLVCVLIPTAGAAQQCEAPDDFAAQIRALREEVQAMRVQLDSLQRASAGASEEQELLQAKVNDQEQTKVESGSKHHVRLSGFALLNLVGARGTVDNLDLPLTAQPTPAGQPNGSIGFGVRQSSATLEVFGPAVGGARTAADVSFDFFGGFPAAGDGLSSPFARLRTATFRMDWEATSIVAGQDALFFSPRSPTSLISSAYPALSAAGNAWSWTPQVRVERRVAVNGSSSTIVVQAGILDPLSGELPGSEYERMPTAGERSRVPAQAARVAWQRGAGDRRTSLGAGAYHAIQDWGFGRTIHAWSVGADWDVPLGPWFALSGEIYRGQALGGLGSGASDSVVFAGASNDPLSVLQPVNTAGGWSQVKFKPTARLEFNAAAGEDNPFKSRLRPLVTSGGTQAIVNHNASAFVNAIYQARSNLFFSVEYRRLSTAGLDDITYTADHFSITTGVGF